MPDPLKPKTTFERGPGREEPIELDSNRPETLAEAGGDTAGNEMQNVGGAPASAGLDSGGAVGVRRGLSVGRAGDEYESAPFGETSSDSPYEPFPPEESTRRS